MVIDSNAIYVHCDGAMEYDSKSTGGVGFTITFPDFVNLPSISKSLGKYQGANIERLELEALIQAIAEMIKQFRIHRDELRNIKRVIVLTDRMGLSDQAKTNAYRIRDWRKNKWYNYEGKAVKNSDLLDKLDKDRKKFSDQTFCSVEIRHVRRRHNKAADKLAKAGKDGAFINTSIALKGAKIGKRLHDDIEVDYSLLREGAEYCIHVFRKEPVREQWEVWGDICETLLHGKKLRMYVDTETERTMHRNHKYKIKIKNVFSHHITVYENIEEWCECQLFP